MSRATQIEMTPVLIAAIPSRTAIGVVPATNEAIRMHGKKNILRSAPFDGRGFSRALHRRVGPATYVGPLPAMPAARVPTRQLCPAQSMMSSTMPWTMPKIAAASKPKLSTL